MSVISDNILNLEKITELKDKDDKIKSKKLDDLDIIKNYDDIKKQNQINSIWDKFLNMPKNKNQNLVFIDIILKQKEKINQTKIDKELETINKALKYINQSCENYFINDKYLDSNYELKFINDLLIYLTKLIICRGIENIMRKILYEYFSVSKTTEDTIRKVEKYYAISDKINYILENGIDEINDKSSMKDILYYDIPKRLVKSSVNIFKNKAEENLYSNESVRDILTEFFETLRIFGNLLSDSIINVFMSNVITYFDTFVSRTILLWLVNVENIFKFCINNYRSLDILLQLSSDNDKKDYEIYKKLEKNIQDNYSQIITDIKSKTNLDNYIHLLFPSDIESNNDDKTYLTNTTAHDFLNSKWKDIYSEIKGMKDIISRFTDKKPIYHFYKFFKELELNDDDYTNLNSNKKKFDDFLDNLLEKLAAS